MAFRVKVGDPGGQAAFLHRAGVARARCEIALPCSCVDALSFENQRSPPLPGSPREPHCTCRPSGAAPSQPSRLPKRCCRAVTVTRRLAPHTPHRLPTLCGCVRLASEPRAFALVRWRLRVSHNAPVSPLRPFVGPRPGGSPAAKSPRGPLLWCTAAAPRWRPKSANRIFLGNVTLTPCKAGTPPLEDRFVLRSRLSHTTFVMRRG